MNLSQETIGDVQVIRVREDRIDAAAAVDFKAQMTAMTAAGGTRVILDLANVSFVDSSGLGAIVASMKQMEGRKLELAGMQETVAQVFRLTRMDSVFPIHDSVSEAVSRSQSAA